MKKKGLIIATIVMVLVLAVSLTTATYAWFTADARASVTSIGVGVTTDAKVMIGVSNTNGFTSDTAIETNFQYGAVTYDAAGDQGTGYKWSAGQQGLGTSIDTGLTMTSISKAVFPTTSATGNDATALTIAANNAAFDANKDNLWVKSAGNGNTLGVAGQYQFAYANNHDVSGTKTPGDYLDVTFGVRAAKGNIGRIGIVLGFDSANTVNLGMCAAFNYWYQIKSGDASGLQEFYSDAYTKTIETMTAPKNDWTNAAWATADGLSWTPAAGDATHVINIAGSHNSSAPLDQTVIYEIRVIIFLNGWDSDCNNSAAAAGVATGSNIRIDFITEDTVTNG